MNLEERAIWIVCIEDAFNAKFFDEIIKDQSDWTCNRTIRFFEDWVHMLKEKQSR